MAAAKRVKLSHRHNKQPQSGGGGGGGEGNHYQPLFPGLPDHLAQLCLSSLPPSLLFSVCRSWRRLLYSPTFPPFLSLYAILYDSVSNTNPSITFSSFDPLSNSWSPLPPPPPPLDPPLLLHHPSFLSRRLPVQSLAASAHLLIIAASTSSLLPALSSPLLFHPSPPRWFSGPALPLSPRRWCAASNIAGGGVFVASGVGASYDPVVARSAARWDLRGGGSAGAWEPLAPMRDGRFSRDAVGAVSSNGKVCLVNLCGRGPKEGAVYNVSSDRWEDMPAGLLAGWTGPAASSSGEGADDTIYVVDEASGALSAYDWESDMWKTVVVSNRLRGAVQLAVGGGRVCAVVGGGDSVAVVDVASPEMGRIWVVDPPSGKNILAVHLLPRMSRPES
ncbi:F-box/kelch-repeat protein SKIP25 [Typha latifolia]|uniref:F-box/kelch-repeat protein SKIP25 n=1 Tax=Typha latifolia TaxID=4733 RepID=UPI003C2AFBC0